jgi:hypothetical protein
LPANLHRLANKLYLVVFMTAYHHSIYCDLIHNEDATNQNIKVTGIAWFKCYPV